MKKYKILLSIFLIPFIFVLIGCSSSNVKEGSRYRFDRIDSILIKNNGNICARLQDIGSDFYPEYNVMTFCYEHINRGNIDTILFVVLSGKSLNDTISFNEYESLKTNEEYCLNLETQKTPLQAQVSIRGKEYCFVQYLDEEANLKFYEKGYIVAKVYKSMDIKGIYILKNKRKDK